MLFGGPQRATRPGDENVHSGAAGGGRRDACRCRGRRAGASTKPWKHGIIAPKADAGFLLMAAKRGFAEREGLKLELLEVKDDQIGLKALLAGELDSYEGGPQGAFAAAT